MSRHEGVRCDYCLKRNFRGKRFKCLVCFNYDLCAVCYDTGVATVTHSVDHPMQCLLTRNDFDLYYAGEVITGECQSFTCPCCGTMGFTEQALISHVTAEHADQSSQVSCPICSSLSEGIPSQITQEFPVHLAMEHGNHVRDIISFLDEPSRQTVHRIPTVSPRGMPSSRSNLPSRPNVSFRFPNGSSRTFASVSSSFESVDPLSEFISHLSSVGREGPAAMETRQLHRMQERVQAVSHQLERGALIRRPRRQTISNGSTQPQPVNLEPKKDERPSSSDCDKNCKYKLLKEITTNYDSNHPVASEDKKLFVQELVLSSLLKQLKLPSQFKTPPKSYEKIVKSHKSSEKKATVTSSVSSSEDIPEDVKPKLSLDSPLKLLLKKRGT